MVQSCGFPPRLLTNAILVPSGDHAGSTSWKASFSSLTGVPPAELMAHSCHCPVAFPAYPIILPSGDHVGTESDAPSNVRRLAGAFGTAFITQICGDPLRVLTNAIRVPSGDRAGCESAAGFTVSRVWFAPLASIT